MKYVLIRSNSAQEVARLCCALVLVIAGATSWGQDEDRVEDLTDLSLEELLDMEITSVSKKAERRSAAAAAIYVVTNEDIARSGATTIPEVLRGVPGISVARLDGNKWSVTSRGFAGVFANKLLVLVDGRSVYTPLFSGTYWDALGLPLEDVDRIEVIRGPGGTIWGANAVNGVINIVTKNSEDTIGGFLTLGGGDEEDGFGTFRYGFRVDENLTGRFYMSHRRQDTSTFPGGGEAHDNWWRSQVGARFDWRPTEDDLLTFQGDFFSTKQNETIELTQVRLPNSFIRDSAIDRHAFNVLTRWSHRINDDSDWQLQLYYDRWISENPRTIKEQRNTMDLDFQHRFKLGDRHDIVWGLGLRYTDSKIETTQWLQFDPTQRNDHIYSAFIQDEIELIPDRLNLTIGSKFEHNDYTGFEMQPSARLAWTPTGNQTVWASISRAVRTPSQAEFDTILPNIALPRVLIALIGDTGYDSEELWAYELGYRISPRDNLTFDMALFYNDYSDLRTVELDLPEFGFRPWPPHLLIPVRARNNLDAQTYGFELAANWQPVDWWTTKLTYSYINLDFDLHAETIDIISGIQEGDVPEHQVHWQNIFQIRDDLEFAMTLRYVDELGPLAVDEYFTADARIAWQIRDNMEFSIVGQNLLDSGHTEFAPTFVNTLATEVERSIYGKFTWRF